MLTWHAKANQGRIKKATFTTCHLATVEHIVFSASCKIAWFLSFTPIASWSHATWYESESITTFSTVKAFPPFKKSLKIASLKIFCSSFHSSFVLCNTLTELSARVALEIYSAVYGQQTTNRWCSLKRSTNISSGGRQPRQGAHWALHTDTLKKSLTLLMGPASS